MMGPARAWPALSSPILSARGKLRMLCETLLPRGAGGDESVGSFVRRRFGKEVLDRLAQPLMGGIYGTNVEWLSLHATMPRFANLEAEHRSVTLGLMRKASTEDQASGARYGLFVSFRDGVQTLTDALAERISPRLALGDEATKLTRLADGKYGVERRRGRAITADAVVLALPARPMSRLIHSLNRGLADSLLDIPYGSSAAVHLCFRRGDVAQPLDAFGFVVPKSERRRVIASTWASVKFEGRAPADRALLRFFFGGDGNEEMLELADDRLVHAARAEAEALLGIKAEPIFSHVARHPHAMPKYLVGHGDRVRTIERHRQTHPGLELAGNCMYGVGIPDAIKSGERAAERVAARWPT
jgi:oxygen-dependent protoporphyrinogen oxidase